jgi:competence protein ComEA
MINSPMKLSVRNNKFFKFHFLPIYQSHKLISKTFCFGKTKEILMKDFFKIMFISATLVLSMPALASTPPLDSPAATQTKPAHLNLNTASFKELMTINGINAYKARAIVSYRKKNGNFKSLDELAKVKGFTRLKEDDLKLIQDQLSV